MIAPLLQYYVKAVGLFAFCKSNSDLAGSARGLLVPGAAIIVTHPTLLGIVPAAKFRFIKQFGAPIVTTTSLRTSPQTGAAIRSPI